LDCLFNPLLRKTPEHLVELGDQTLVLGEVCLERGTPDNQLVRLVEKAALAVDGLRGRVSSPAHSTTQIPDIYRAGKGVLEDQLGWMEGHRGRDQFRKIGDKKRYGTVLLAR
jgi:hypothetical protein